MLGGSALPSILFGVRPLDPLVLSGTAAVVVTLAALGSVSALLRALDVEPGEALAD